MVTCPSYAISFSNRLRTFFKGVRCRDFPCFLFFFFLPSMISSFSIWFDKCPIDINFLIIYFAPVHLINSSPCIAVLWVLYKRIPFAPTFPPVLRNTQFDNLAKIGEGVSNIGFNHLFMESGYKNNPTLF
eukprot:Lithocolla_globosa_v1_NODE_4732_length_1377_cov_11.537415.p3 type:complete len:130 gc:universal NODE_4732_length_1377_cov_11.537415:606-217(-)